jgi:hypothetical protein
LLQLLPEDLGDIVHRFRVGKFELQHEHRHLQASVHHLVQGLLTAALLLSSALLLGQSERFVPSLMRLVLGLAFLICAVLLGFRLLWAIRAAERRSPWE